MPTNIIIDGTAGGVVADQPGSDQITFGANAATLSAGQGTDTVAGGSGELLIDATGDANPISIRGGAGDLTFSGGAGPATIAGGSGRVTVLPSNGSISLVAGGGPIDIYSKDSWSGYYELTPAPSDTLTVAFDSASGEVFVLDRASGKTLVVGQGFAFFQNDPGTLLSAWTEPQVTITGLTSATRTGGSSDPFTTADAAPVLVGTAPPNTAVLITSADGIALAAAVTSDAQGNWTAALSQLPYGETDVIASAAIDAALPPFESSAASAVHIVPPAPTIDGFTDSSGAHAGGGTTLDRQPHLTGTAPAGTSVQVFAGGTLLGAATVSGAAWSYDPPAPLPEGAYQLTAVATDAATGVASAASAPLALGIVLGAPTTDGFTDATGFKTGGDTLDHRPAFGGAAPDGTSVSVYDDGALIGTASVSGGAWSFTPATDLADGAHAITAIAEDPATGALSAASAVLAIRIDPAAPTLAGLTGASGSHQSGDSVADAALVLSGAADPGTVVTVSDGAAVLGTATVTGSAWTFALPSGLAYGPHSLTAVATDPSDSLVSAASAAFAFTQTPPAPVVSGLTAATDTGASSSDGITSDADPTITGTAVAGDLVSVFDGGALLGTTAADGAGAWRLAPAAPLAYGPHVITATDAAANGQATSAQGAATTIVIQPASPTIDGFTDSSGAHAGGGTTLDRQPHLTGTAPAGTSVQVFAGGTLLGAATVSGAAWSYDPPAPLPEGAYQLTAVATDAATGVASAASAPLALGIVLGAPTTDGFTDATGFKTGGDTLDHRPAFGGAAPDGTSVSVYDDGALIGTASVSGGAWSFTPATDLADGAHAITAIAEDPATGALSAASAVLAIRIDPAAPTLAGLTGASGSHQSGDSVADAALVLSGAADPGTVVTVSDGAAVLGTATVTGSAWTFALPSGLAYGPHSLTAVATDPSDSLVSAASAAFAFTQTPPAPVVSGLTAATDTGASSSDGITSDADPTITGTAVAGDLVSVFDGGALLGTTAADGAGAWRLAPAAPLAYGPHVITATDAAANGQATSGTGAGRTVVIVAPAPLITALDGAGGATPLSGAVTADRRPTVSGTGQTGSFVAVYDGSTLIGSSGAIGADGSWSVATSAPLSAGLHILTAVATDAAGRGSETSATLSVVVNPPPGQPGAGGDRFATAIRASIASLLAPGSGGDNAVIYKQPGQTSAANPSGGVSGLSIDDASAGQTIRVPDSTDFVSDIASGPVTVLGADGGRQVAVSIKGDLTYVAGDGSGVLLSDQSPGRTILFGSHARSSHFVAATGSGDDILIAGDGDTSLSGGGGSNIFWLGAGETQVDAAGVDTVVGGGGAETVIGGSDTTAAAGTHSTLLFGGAGKLTFINISGGSTVSGGSGSSTLLGGQGSALFFGGKAGGNVIVGGTGPSTLIGGGDGDQLWAGKAGGDVLAAQGDHATLGGGGSTGDNLYFGGSGHNVIAAGLGNDTISGGSGQSTIFAGAGRDLIFAADQGGVIDAGSGNATLVGSAGAELYGFSDGQAGGDVLIYNFRSGTDHLAFQGYAAGSVQTALQKQTVIDGSTHVLLSDGTRITFAGLAHLGADDVV